MKFIILILSIVLIFGHSQAQDTHKSSIQDLRPNSIEEARELIKLSEVKFSDVRKNEKSMTSFQFEEYVKSIIGKQVRWGGYVQEVKSDTHDSAIVYIDMDNPNKNDFSMPELRFPVSKEAALKMKKGGRIYISGNIKNLTGGMWIDVDLENMYATVFD